MTPIPPPHPRSHLGLQGLLTQDVRHLTSKPLYSCILNAQGRFLHDVFLHPASQGVYADVDRSGLADVLRLLKRYVGGGTCLTRIHHPHGRYRLHSKVDIEDASSEMAVCVAYGSARAVAEWPRDPRLAALGQRTVIPSVQAPDGGAVGFRAWRVLHGVAEGDEEIPTGRV